jgi:hypothetical protein
MSRSLTIKQLAREKFWEALDEYKEALSTGENIVWASLQVHMALNGEGIPKSYRRLVTKAFSEAGKEKA